ncbi:hypothetical protein BGZ47_008368 [Haplosporangium gracile]|nr:hypothetical protein BGZ47_008368 [Haplosporangium gracile]
MYVVTLLQVTIFWDSNLYYIESDEVLSMDDHFRESGRAVQLLPRRCSYLKFLEFERYEMDMDVVDEKK